MLLRKHQEQSPKEQHSSYDELMAKLLALLCQRELGNDEASHSPDSLAQLVFLLDQVLSHDDSEHFPQERQVLIKMQHVWQTQLFRQQASGQLH